MTDLKKQERQVNAQHLLQNTWMYAYEKLNSLFHENQNTHESRIMKTLPNGHGQSICVHITEINLADHVCSALLLLESWATFASIGGEHWPWMDQEREVKGERDLLAGHPTDFLATSDQP